MQLEASYVSRLYSHYSSNIQFTVRRDVLRGGGGGLTSSQRKERVKCIFRVCIKLFDERASLNSCIFLGHYPSYSSVKTHDDLEADCAPATR
jgi:hypothetical protein